MSVSDSAAGTVPVPSGPASNFTDDDAPVNALGERRFVGRLRWFGPLNLGMVLAAAIPTGGAASIMAYNFTIHLAEQEANAAIGVANLFGALAGALAAIVAGNLSDHTRTRWGRRNPGILGGALLAAAGVLLMTVMPVAAVWPVVLCFCLFQIGLNTLLANFTSLLADRVHSGLMGRASAWGSLGTLLGAALGGVVVRLLVEAFGAERLSLGFAVLPWMMVVMAIVVVLALPGATLTKTPDAERPSLRAMLASFRPPADRDFWFVYLSRLCLMIALMMLVQTQTQQLIYHFSLSLDEATAIGATLGILTATGAVLAAVVAGPVSDKIKRRKVPVAIATLLLVIAAGCLLITDQPWILYIQTLLASFAFGAFASVDQALMVEVLPTRETAARDLGFLGTTNTLSGVFGGVIGASIIGLFGYTVLFVSAMAIALASLAFLIPVRRVR